MEENKYKKEMRSLEKIKAPDDFLNQVISRLDRASFFERVKQFLFVPVRIKVPLQIAAAATTIIVIFSVYKMAQPSGQIAYLAPKARMERALKKGVLPEDKAEVKRSAAFVAKRPAPIAVEEKPIEIALLVKAEKEIIAAAPSEMAMGPAGARMGADELGTKDRSFPAPTPDNITTVRELVKKSQVNIISVDSEKNIVVLEVPLNNLAAFLAKLKELGDLEGAVSAKAEKETVRLRLQIILIE